MFTSDSARSALAVNRRALIGGFSLLALAAGTRPMAAGAAAGAAPGAQPADWPRWARPLAAIYGDLGALSAGAVDLRSFGAALDGVRDDTPALERAIASRARAIVITGPARLTRSVTISRPVAVFGRGTGPHIIWAGPANSSAFAIGAPPAQGNAVHAFVNGVSFARLNVVRDRGQAPGGNLVRAINVRGLVVADCQTHGVGLAFVSHALMETRRYRRDAGSETVDPAVVAGFSPNSLDDLNEDITVLNNTVDCGKYMGALLRFNFARRVLVFGNKGRFAAISWWGGGAKRPEGGMPQFLRRVRDAYIAQNEVCNVNGGIYGNNGQNVVVARNRVWDTTDVGIDFEGCMDCIAYDNHVKNAGNFCYATFFVANNIRFERNYGEQDGSAANLDAQFGSKPYGKPTGRCLTALRSAGYAGVPGAINVTYAQNEFVFSGKGLGRCLPSYFNSVSFIGNHFRNVVCDMRYANGDNLVIASNSFVFDRASQAAVTLLGGTAPHGRIEDNRISVAAPMSAGTVAIGYEVGGQSRGVSIARNTMQGNGDMPVVVVTPSPQATGVTIGSNAGFRVDRRLRAAPGNGAMRSMALPQFAN